EDPEHLRETSIALDRLAEARASLKQHEAAAVLLDESLTMTRRLHARTPDEPGAIRDLVISLNLRSENHEALKQMDEALALLNESLALLERTVSTRPDEPDWRLRHLTALNRLAMLQWNLRDREASLTTYERRLIHSRERAERFPGKPEHWQDIAANLDEIIRMRTILDRADGLEDIAIEATEARRAAVAHGHEEPELVRLLAESLGQLGRVRLQLGKEADAEKAFLEAR